MGPLHHNGEDVMKPRVGKGLGELDVKCRDGGTRVWSPWTIKHVERRSGVQKSIQFGDVTTESIYRVSLPALSRYHNLKKSVSVPLEMSGCALRE